METVQIRLAQVSDMVWGLPTIILLVGTGVYLTFVLRGVQLRRLRHALWLALVKRRDPGAEGDISHFQALMTGLGTTAGVAGIVGVATAIAAGGPGALFWMWVTALLGMATRYAEALLGVQYREVDRRGNMAGGPMYYLSRGVGGTAGRVLGGAFALFAAIAAFGIGCMVQSNSAAHALQASFSVPPLLTGIVIAALVAAVILGGIRSIGQVAGTLVPALVLLYLAGGLVVLALRWRTLDDIVVGVMSDAFSSSAAVGGFLGASVREAVRWGLARGAFGSGSGLGTAAIAAAAARTPSSTAQALVSMTQTFIDTIVVCTITGFVIIGTGVYGRLDAAGAALTGAPLAVAAFEAGLPGGIGAHFVSLGLVFFAFSTLLGWAYYGEQAVEYLFGLRATTPYRLLFVAAAFAGAAVLQLGQVDGLRLVWTFSDIFNGAMVIPNLVGLLLLSGVVVRETRRAFDGPPGR